MAQIPIFSEDIPLFAEVILPLPGGVYTYAVGEELRKKIGRGSLVTVPLGPSKIYTGLVRGFVRERPHYGNIRPVFTVHEGFPVIGDAMLRLWSWVADYYMCSEGEVMRTAIPAALKPSGLTDLEIGQKSYRPSTVVSVGLGEGACEPGRLNEAFEKLSARAPGMYKALAALVEALGSDDPFGKEVPRERVDAGADVLGRLEKRGYIVRREKELLPGEGPRDEIFPVSLLPRLSEPQAAALEGIREAFQTKDTVLLHGVTGSGKTEIYIRLIAEQLAAGKDVLYLLPEIAMTSQTVSRLKKFFGRDVVTYHSSYPVRRKTENFIRAATSRGGTLVVGVRSAVFLPGQRLGMLVIDEEHDPSYKNHESAPRYNARDTAIVLAGMTGAKTLMGSATPSLESYANALAGKYGYIYLAERYGGSPMPRIVVSDTTKAVKRGERRSHFNKLTIDSISAVLERGRQAILFQNRRGFSPYIECPGCGWTASCPHCNVTLTYHKSEGSLRCHYCGHGESMPPFCPACGTKGVETRGFGTEKIEEELAALFPGARIERLDRDTATSEVRFGGIVRSFERGRTDILVGTQMITKGFDFEGVSFVGVLNADNLLAYPDFRASERAFQLLTQVAGRAGRRQEQGLVVIQTSQPQHPVIVRAAAGDYTAMARAQLTERREFFYPPFCRIIDIYLHHPDRQAVTAAAAALAGELRRVFGRRVNGPQPPPVDRVRGRYIERIMLKIERESSLGKARKLLAGKIEELQKDEKFRRVKIYCDPDPI
ncbi:MAG: primosomal protein N' [Rikenellaceae bacterium]|nr:primosomal protein N' [Rikenellaceae bacterium]